ncbi:MAG: serine/threonine protein kinase [Candidatus Obscuribacterales bacterium]|jgi:serine/threonine-protein kinase|nr:serine/threonine protein kinase [Candidatus Obscuribacterales bacterium]
MNGEPSLSNTSKAGLASGSLIAGRYEVIAELGRGGMSVVYLCVEKMLDRQVAVKLFNLLEGENYFLDRFQKEARAISALSHPNIVKVFASGIDGQHPYIVMEYLSGETLEDVLKLGPLMPDRFMSIFAVVCDAVIHAHEQQIIHRDLKPANIMLAKSGDTGSGAVKILDFSVAKILSDDPTMDKTIGLAGTPYYMSPEQCTGAPLDARSDVYSLGCLMYECITGIRPFEGDSSFKILYGHMHEPVPPFADHGHSKLYSKELKALIQKCLSKKPDDRPQHVAQVKQNLESYSTVQTSAGSLVTAAITTSAAQTTIASSFQTPGAVLRAPGSSLHNRRDFFA